MADSLYTSDKETFEEIEVLALDMAWAALPEPDKGDTADAIKSATAAGKIRLTSATAQTDLRRRIFFSGSFSSGIYARKMLDIISQHGSAEGYVMSHVEKLERELTEIAEGGTATLLVPHPDKPRTLKPVAITEARDRNRHIALARAVKAAGGANSSVQEVVRWDEVVALSDSVTSKRTLMTKLSALLVDVLKVEGAGNARFARLAKAQEPVEQAVAVSRLIHALSKTPAGRAYYKAQFEGSDDAALLHRTRIDALASLLEPDAAKPGEVVFAAEPWASITGKPKGEAETAIAKLSADTERFGKALKLASAAQAVAALSAQFGVGPDLDLKTVMPRMHGCAGKWAAVDVVTLKTNIGRLKALKTALAWITGAASMKADDFKNPTKIYGLVNDTAGLVGAVADFMGSFQAKPDGYGPVGLTSKVSAAAAIFGTAFSAADALMALHGLHAKDGEDLAFGMAGFAASAIPLLVKYAVWAGFVVAGPGTMTVLAIATVVGLVVAVRGWVAPDDAVEAAKVCYFSKDFSTPSQRYDQFILNRVREKDVSFPGWAFQYKDEASGFVFDNFARQIGVMTGYGGGTGFTASRNILGGGFLKLEAKLPPGSTSTLWDVTDKQKAAVAHGTITDRDAGKQPQELEDAIETTGRKVGYLARQFAVIRSRTTQGSKGFVDITDGEPGLDSDLGYTFPQKFEVRTTVVGMKAWAPRIEEEEENVPEFHLIERREVTSTWRR